MSTTRARPGPRGSTSCAHGLQHRELAHRGRRAEQRAHREVVERQPGQHAGPEERRGAAAQGLVGRTTTCSTLLAHRRERASTRLAVAELDEHGAAAAGGVASAASPAATVVLPTPPLPITSEEAAGFMRRASRPWLPSRRAS
jgi:hypothetical protein